MDMPAKSKKQRECSIISASSSQFLSCHYLATLLKQKLRERKDFDLRMSSGFKGDGSEISWADAGHEKHHSTTPLSSLKSSELPTTHLSH
jgi:hypothetical protein